MREVEHSGAPDSPYELDEKTKRRRAQWRAYYERVKVDPIRLARRRDQVRAADKRWEQRNPERTRASGRERARRYRARKRKPDAGG